MRSQQAAICLIRVCDVNRKAKKKTCETRTKNSQKQKKKEFYKECPKVYIYCIPLTLL